MNRLYARSQGKCWRLWALLVLALLLGQGCAHLNWAIPTDPIPTPTPEPVADAWYEPIYSHAQYDSGYPVGVCLTTGDGVLGVEDRRTWGSISCGWVQLQDCVTGEVCKVSANTSQWTSPGGVDNWAKAGPHWYTTAHTVNDAGTNPTADGTRRGRVIIPWDRPGSWHVWLQYRATGNRGTAWLGITQDYQGQEVTYWYEWDQTGTGPYPAVLVKDEAGGTCLAFVVPETTEGGLE